MEPIYPLLDIESNDSDSDGDFDLGKLVKAIDLNKSCLSDTLLLVHHDQDPLIERTELCQRSETHTFLEANQVETE